MTVAPPVTDQYAKILDDVFPVCHWVIDEQCRFIRASGDTSRLFLKSPQELTGRTIPEISGERMALRWVLALRRVFAGEPLVEEVRLGKPEVRWFVVHLPLRGENGQILFAAGFALDAQPRKEAARRGRARDLRGRAPSGRTEASSAQFLHDEVAQSLSAAGLQLDLLRMDLEARVPEIAARTAEVQTLLNEALRRMRAFMAGTSP